MDSKTQSHIQKQNLLDQKKERETIDVQEERGVKNYLHVIYKRESLQEGNIKV